MNQFKSVPERRQSLAMIKNEYVLLLNGNTRIVVREKTASFKDGSLTGFKIWSVQTIRLKQSWQEIINNAA